MAGRCTDSAPFRCHRLSLRKELGGLWLCGKSATHGVLVVRTTHFPSGSFHTHTTTIPWGPRASNLILPSTPASSSPR